LDWNWYSWLGPWLGDLHHVSRLTEHMIGVITIGAAGLCGAIIGLEREKREKPAGLRTLILICVGCAMFTLASLLMGNSHADRSRIASNVIPGIGFLGAGAIIHERRTVVGLTTAATIWSVAAIGIIVGIGYAAAGIVLAFFIFLVLSFLRLLEQWLFGPCRWTTSRIDFRGLRGKARMRILSILDENHIPQNAFRFLGPAPDAPGSGTETLEIHHCSAHRLHRAFLADVVALPEVEAVEERPTGGWK